MAYVKYSLADQTEVFFETDDEAFVSQRGGDDVVEGGELSDRLQVIAKAAAEISRGLRQHLSPDKVELTFGVKMSGSVNWWFFAKAQGEATMQVKLRWERGDGGEHRPS